MHRDASNGSAAVASGASRGVPPVASSSSASAASAGRCSREREQAVLVRLPNIVQPLRRDAVTEKLLVRGRAQEA